jgi:copper chaperone CopZ
MYFPHLICFSKYLQAELNLVLSSNQAFSVNSINLFIMKTIKLLLAIIVIMAVGVKASAQTVTKTSIQQKTESFKVWGKCEMCKTRIEKTAKAEGATSAEWNLKTKMLTVSFDPAKTSVESLSKKLAAAGHDTEKYKADDKVYNALDDCCKYDRTK